MKKLLVTLAAAFASYTASAAPVIQLPAGPIYLEYSGQEQIAINGATTFAGTKEINWCVFTVTALTLGQVSSPNDLIDKTDDQAAFFNNIISGGQITGMFYGIEKGGASAGNSFPATKGFLDLYWRDLNDLPASSTSTGTLPDIRCGFSCAKGFTEGTLLARLYFDSGMDAFNPLNTITGSQVPSTSGFNGLAASYASVDTSAKGAWTDTLNSNWFTTAQGSRDLRFDNVYRTNTAWNGAPGSNILGARVNAGSGQSYALPEPGALSLMGLAMIGMGAALRRRSRK
jgi:hypothetical protein